MNNKIILIGAITAVMISGCTLKPDSDIYNTLEVAVSGNDVESSSEIIDMPSSDLDSIVIDIPASSEKDPFEEYETVAIPDVEEPVDDTGVWTDYIVQSQDVTFDYDTPEYGENGCRFILTACPVIQVSDADKHKEINDTIGPYITNHFPERFLMYNVDIELTCTVLSQTRFVSYQFEGVVKHTGDDDRFEDEIEYRYYFTIDRMTGQVINLETAMGVKSAYEQIKNGEYEVVRGEKSVFEKFSNDLLADVYVNEPVFADDTDHELDFYIQDGSVHVVVWVGEENGNYAILKLKEPSKI